MTFDRRQYDQELEQAVMRVRECVPHDEAAHTLRRFLWPWQWAGVYRGTDGEAELGRTLKAA